MDRQVHMDPAELKEIKKTIETAARYKFDRFFIEDNQVSVIALKEIFKKSSKIYIYGDLEEDWEEQFKKDGINFSNTIRKFIEKPGNILKIIIPDPEKFKTSSFYNFLQPYLEKYRFRTELRLAHENLFKIAQDRQYKEIILSDEKFLRLKTGHLTDPQKTFQTQINFNADKEFYSLEKLFNASSHSVSALKLGDLKEAVPEFASEFSKNLS